MVNISPLHGIQRLKALSSQPCWHPPWQLHGSLLPYYIELFCHWLSPSGKCVFLQYHHQQNWKWKIIMLNKFSLTKSVILFRKFVPDCSDVRMITNKVDTVMLTMDDIDSTIRSPSISQKLYKSHTSCWIPFTWLHYVGVSSY